MALFCFSAMPELPPPAFGNFFFFPLTFQSTGAGSSYNTKHLQNDASDRFIARQERGLWHFSLGGMLILADFIDEWDAFHDAVKGMWKPSLVRLASRRFEIAKNQVGSDGQPCGIATGDGVTGTFQLRKARTYGYGPSNQTWENVRFPWHNYPQMKSPLGNGTGTIIYDTEYVRIWVNGVEMPWLSGWDVDRETGLVTFDEAPANGVLIQAACKFFVAVHGQDLYVLQHESSYWSFPAGAELFQVVSER